MYKNLVEILKEKESRSKHTRNCWESLKSPHRTKSTQEQSSHWAKH